MHEKSKMLRTTDIGLEKLCSKCDQWWPADTDFFHADPAGTARLFYCCKACYQEHFGLARRTKQGRKPIEPAGPTPGELVLYQAMGQPVSVDRVWLVS